jgi:3-oxoisoapionate kinase
MNPLLLAYYGDDFTGSTDVMEALALSGVPTALFLSPPRAEDLADFPHLRAVGVAGLTRTLPPAAMEAVLRPAFEALHQLGPELVHYKVCSTFDSAPHVGSIGCAIEVGRGYFRPRIVPVCVGAPRLGRFVAFGHLFARVGQEIHRLDRHPTMSRHPVTPMNESDLRRHLAAQTDTPVGLIDCLTLDHSPDGAMGAMEARVAAGTPPIVFVDTLNETHLARAGQVLWDLRTANPFIVGSSGVEWALATRWQQLGIATPPATLPSSGPVDRILAICGSASPVTDGQIAEALQAGYAGLRLNLPDLLHPERSAAACSQAVSAAAAALDRGQSVVLFSARGPDDPAIAETRAAAARYQLPDPGAAIGQIQGRILAGIRAVTSVRRAVVAGGDTSGHVSTALGIRALEFLMPLTAGSPLCRAHLEGDRTDALELVLKGGQNGSPQLFESVRLGRTEHAATLPTSPAGPL